MKFQVSANRLANKLSALTKVMNTKTVLPILSNFLFEMDGNTLRVTASDGECTQCSTITIANTEGNGKICLPVERLLDALKSLPEQLIEFDINEENFETIIKYDNGKFDLMGYSTDEYVIPSSLDNIEEILIETTTLNTAITQSMFAVGNDELRPIMNGIFIATKEKTFQCAASDGHKLVRNTYKLETPIKSLNFVLPTKAAKLVKSLTDKVTIPVTINHNGREAIFFFENDTLRCRLLEGKYPNYNAIIPLENHNTATIERNYLLSSIRRVGLFSSVANGIIEMTFSDKGIEMSGKDIDYSTSAKESLLCAYSGEKLRIGFKGELLKQILENFTSKEVTLEMGDCSTAAIIKPIGGDDKTENLSLLIPMMLEA